MMKKWMCMALLTAGIVSLSLTAYAESGAENAEGTQAEERVISTTDTASALKYEFTPAGSIQTDERLSFMRDAIFVQEDDTYSMMSISGEKIVGPVSSAEYLGDGVYTVTEPLLEDDVNKTGLFTEEGEVILPCEAAAVKKPINRESGGVRFLEVIYTTGKTDNEDECIIYFTDDMISLSVGEDDVMYKGYVKIFDLKKGQFVNDVEFTQANRNGFHDFGNSFAIEHGGQVTMYDENGVQIWESGGMVNASTYNALTIFSGGKYYIVDGSGKDRFAADASIDRCSKPMDIYKIYDGEDDTPYHLIDMDGNQLVPDAYGSIIDATAECILAKTTKDAENYTAIGTDGTVLAENVDYSSVATGSYMYMQSKETEEYMVSSPAGFFDGLEYGEVRKLGFLKDGKPLILNTGETVDVPEDGSRSMIGLGLLKTEEKTSSGTNYALYDLFTGEQVLPAEYANIEAAGEYICAAKTDSSGKKTWEVYHTALVPAA